MNEEYFNEDALQLFNGVGRQLGIAIENARLWEELRHRDNMRGQLLKQVINAQEEERRRIAQLQELENTIAELESQLVSFRSQLESPLVKPEEVAKLGTEYERVQKEMDKKLNEWERMQG